MYHGRLLLRVRQLSISFMQLDGRTPISVCERSPGTVPRRYLQGCIAQSLLEGVLLNYHLEIPRSRWAGHSPMLKTCCLQLTWQRQLTLAVATKQGQPAAQGWQDVPMYRTPSRAQPAGGEWMTAVIPAIRDLAEGPSGLEFVACSRTGQVDRPLGSQSYVCQHPGGYKLQRGSLLPFPRAKAAPTMLVCAFCPGSFNKQQGHPV